MHSDHGANFTSWGFSENLRTWDVTPSLGTVRDSFNDAAMESLLGRVQTELLDTRKTWKTVVELITIMEAWVDSYNEKRRRSYVGYMSPDQYEVLWDDLNNPLLLT